ncbi:hypothetical protein K438DRAFT_1624510, partial [Mycena galopus ATCC 62051]
EWPKLSWGLLLRCNLSKFRTGGSKILANKQRLFTILVSTSMHLIWKLRNKYRFEMDINEVPSQIEIHNCWVSPINMALKHDILSTNKVHFETDSTKHLGSGILWQEDSLPDDWIQSDRVLVGIQPLYAKRGIG